MIEANTVSGDDALVVTIPRTDFDSEALARYVNPNHEDPVDYTDVIVTKPWGNEYLLFSNGYMGVWILNVKRTCSTSMHCHVNKKTSLAVLKGEVLCGVHERFIRRGAGQGITFEKGVFHRSVAGPTSDAIIVEIETPVAKHDLVRLEDAYGRSGTAYESNNQHVRAAEHTSTLKFGAAGDEILSRTFGRFSISVLSWPSRRAADFFEDLDDDDLVCLVEANGGRNCYSSARNGEWQLARTLALQPPHRNLVGTAIVIRANRAQRLNVASTNRTTTCCKE